MSNERYYSTRDIAAQLSIKPATVRAWQYRGYLPKPDIKRPRFTRWKETTIRPFLDNPFMYRHTHNTR